MKFHCVIVEYATEAGNLAGLLYPLLAAPGVRPDTQKGTDVEVQGVAPQPPDPIHHKLALPETSLLGAAPSIRFTNMTEAIGVAVLQYSSVHWFPVVQSVWTNRALAPVLSNGDMNRSFEYVAAKLPNVPLLKGVPDVASLAKF